MLLRETVRIPKDCSDDEYVESQEEYETDTFTSDSDEHEEDEDEFIVDNNETMSVEDEVETIDDEFDERHFIIPEITNSTNLPLLPPANVSPSLNDQITIIDDDHSSDDEENDTVNSDSTFTFSNETKDTYASTIIGRAMMRLNLTLLTLLIEKSKSKLVTSVNIRKGSKQLIVSTLIYENYSLDQIRKMRNTTVKIESKLTHLMKSILELKKANGIGKSKKKNKDSGNSPKLFASTGGSILSTSGDVSQSVGSITNRINFNPQLSRSYIHRNTIDWFRNHDSSNSPSSRTHGVVIGEHVDSSNKNVKTPFYNIEGLGIRKCCHCFKQIHNDELKIKYEHSSDKSCLVSNCDHVFHTKCVMVLVETRFENLKGDHSAENRKIKCPVCLLKISTLKTTCDGNNEVWNADSDKRILKEPRICVVE
jgi:hypothetical protein